MNWFDEWTLEQEKKKQKEEEEKKKRLSGEIAPVASTYLTGGVPNVGTMPVSAKLQGDLAPVPVTPKKSDQNKKNQGTWFQKGAFEDGYQKGDVGRASKATAADAAEDATAGVLGSGETILDTLLYMSNLYATGSYYQNGGGYNLKADQAFQQGQAVTKAAVEELVEEDLYDEAAIAKRLVTDATAGRRSLMNGTVDYEAPAWWEADSVLGEKADSLMQSAGQLAVTMGMQAAGVPWWLTTGATTFGAEAENALKEGATFEEAAASATISAAAEILTEKISGGIKLGGKPLDEALAKEISRAITNKYLRTAAKLGLDVAGEGAEEWITEDINRFGQWLTYRSEEELKELLWSEEAMDAKLDAFIGGSLMGGASSTTGAARASWHGVDFASGMTNNEKAVVDRVYKDAVAQEAKKVKDGKVTEARKREIYDEVLKQLDEGGFSIETIEEVLGGDTWKNYNQLRNYQQEYDKLYNMKYSEKSSKDTAREEQLRKWLEDSEGKSRMDPVRQQLHEEVSKLAANDRLAESYAEESRRGQKFTADVTQYAPKMRPTIQKAIDSGILNDRRGTHKFVELVAKITADKGVTFDFANNEKLKESGFAIEGKTVNGYVTAEGITLNIDSPRALNRVVGHEVTHVLEGTELYGELQEMLISMADAKGELQSRTKALEALYQGIEGADITQELTAELVGDYLFSDTDFIQQLSTESPDLFDKVWKEIKYLCKAATAGSKENKRLLAVQKKFEEVYRAEGAKNTVPEDGVRYTFHGYADDGKGIYESNFPKGTPKVAKGERILKYIQDVWSRKPITLRIEQNGEIRYIEAEFDPTYSEDKNVQTDASKLMGGNRHGTSKDQRVTLDLADDYYQIASDSTYNYSKDEEGKTTGPHQDVSQWHYFINDIYFAEQGSDNLEPYRVSINVKEKGDGHYFYSFSAEKAEGTSTQRTLHAAVNDGKNAIANGSSSKFSISDSDTIVNSENDIAPMPGEVYGKDVGLRTAVEDDLAPVRENLDNRNVPESGTDALPDDLAPMAEDGEDIEITTTKQKLEAIRENSRQELARNEQLRQESHDRFTQKIEAAQAKFDGKKNKDTKTAQALLRRIERLKRLQADEDARYAKRINDIERRMRKTDEELQKDHTKADALTRAIAKIDSHLEADKQLLEQEFAWKSEEFADKDAWTANQAKALREELSGLKKGVKASPVLSDILSLRESLGADWSALRSALVNIRYNPGGQVNQNSAIENAVRDLLAENYESGQQDLDAEYQEKLAELEAEADEKRKAAQTANQRKVKTAELWRWAENLIHDTSGWKDKALGIQYEINTLQRNLRDTVRRPDGSKDIKHADAIFDAIGGEYNRNEARMKLKINEIKEWYKKKKITKEESVYIQMLGELRYNPKAAVSGPDVTAYFEAHREQIDPQKVDEVIEKARADYDMMHEMQNAVLREYGLKEIEYHKGYFRHLWTKPQPFWAKVLNWKVSEDGRPPKDNTSVAGLTENFRPNHKWQSYEKQRKGEITDWDFLKGFNSYVDGAMDIVYHTGDIQRRKAFENYIRYIHSDEAIQEQISVVLENDYLNTDEMHEQLDQILSKAGSPLPNFVTDFRTQTNLLAGKKHSLDRGMEQKTNREIYSVASNISNRVSANMVAASASAAMSNFIPVFKSWGEVRPDYTLRALEDYIRSGKQGDGTVEKSTFLLNRLVEIEKLDKSTWDKIGEGVGCLMTAADRISSQTVWRSKYLQNLAKGMSESEAIQDADSFAERLMAGRSRGNQPTLFESKNPITKMFTLFQLEVNNEYGYLFKDLPIEKKSEGIAKLTTAYMEIFLGSYLYNEIFNKITGRDMAFDPIRILAEFFGGLWDEEEDDSEDWEGLAENVLEQTPFIGGLVGGGRVPISSALPYDGNFMEGVTGVAQAVESGLISEDGVPFGTSEWKSVWKELQNPLYYLLPPMAGGQIRKTVQGLDMFLGDEPVAGSYTDSGALRYTVDPTAGNVLQAALFGQWANQNAQQYIDEGRAPLQEKQMEEFLSLDIPIQQYWEYRDGLKGLKTVNEKADYIASLDLPVEKKNILINNIADRKIPIDLKDYDRYEDFAEMDFAVKKPELYSWLQSQGMTVKDYEKSGTAKKDAYSWAAQNPEKYNVSRAVTDDLVAYRVYTKRINSFEADKDADGNSIIGSRKQKIVDYINGLDLDYGAKIILYRMAYSSDDTYNYEIVDYLNSRKDLTYNDMKTILEELGFAVDTKGNVTW